MAAVAAEAAATAASPGEGGAGEAEPEMEPIPGSEAGTDPLPITATEASVPDGEADGQQSAPQADDPPLPPPPPPPGELARSPEAAGPELEAEEKLPVRVAEPEAAAPREGPDLPPSPPAQPPERPRSPDEREETPLSQPAAPGLLPPAGGDSAVSQLIPGSEVRVTLDHIIEDALVVSFRLGEKLFSGVLMDLSKRDLETYGAIALLLVGKKYSHSGAAVSSGISSLYYSIRVENSGLQVVFLNDCAELYIFRTNVFW
ncbi:PWWP domain-containing protein 2A-like [Ochotona princeps]|uniref:PWWP domain-containing protein 2A-like n=1 Tax=Ochotona princeps TaxID=9978 RepID=UPI0027147B4F|nr:PWWP domain-containing protein 2A-like [Ochotona princeps]